MIHKYLVKGMTCEGCAFKIKKELLSVPGITAAQINLKTNEATVEMKEHVSLGVLNDALKKMGNYSLSEEGAPPSASKESSNFKKFLPLIFIFGLIILFTLFRAWRRGSFAWEEIMHDFMGNFFIIFGAFKIINWKGFVESYSTYDILAQRSKIYAYAYPLIELGLGLAYVLRFHLVLTNWITLLVMGVSSIGVAKA